MTKSLSNQEVFAKAVKVLKDAFGPGVDFELIRERDNIIRVKATSDHDGSITDGIAKMKADRLHGAVDGDIAVKMISDEDADEYLIRAALTDDPLLRAGYQALAEEAGGE